MIKLKFALVAKTKVRQSLTAYKFTRQYTIGEIIHIVNCINVLQFIFRLIFRAQHGSARASRKQFCVTRLFKPRCVRTLPYNFPSTASGLTSLYLLHLPPTPFPLPKEPVSMGFMQFFGTIPCSQASLY